jgi:hypothetical protein
VPASTNKRKCSLLVLRIERSQLVDHHQAPGFVQQPRARVGGVEPADALALRLVRSANAAQQVRLATAGATPQVHRCRHGGTRQQAHAGGPPLRSLRTGHQRVEAHLDRGRCMASGICFIRPHPVKSWLAR